MIYLLVTHILIGALLVGAFLSRYASVMIFRSRPKIGKTFIYATSTALVSTGVALVIVAKSTISSACISSLAIIAGVVVLESVLSYTQKRLVTNKNNSYRSGE